MSTPEYQAAGEYGAGPQAGAGELSGGDVRRASADVELDFHIGRRRHPVVTTDMAATPAGAIGASRQVIAGGDVCALLGLAVAETSGAAAAAFRLRDGSGANNEVMVRVNLAANESDRIEFGPHGIHVSTGRIWLEWIAGAFEGVIYWR